MTALEQTRASARPGPCPDTCSGPCLIIARIFRKLRENLYILLSMARMKQGWPGHKDAPNKNKAKKHKIRASGTLKFPMEKSREPLLPVGVGLRLVVAAAVATTQSKPAPGCSSGPCGRTH